MLTFSCFFFPSALLNCFYECGDVDTIWDSRRARSHPVGGVPSSPRQGCELTQRKNCENAARDVTGRIPTFSTTQQSQLQPENKQNQTKLLHCILKRMYHILLVDHLELLKL